MLYRQIQINNKEYADIINDMAKDRGIIKNKEWEWCFKTNSTYLDCPVANYPKEASFIVAIHNPSMQGISISSVKTRSSKY